MPPPIRIVHLLPLPLTLVWRLLTSLGLLNWCNHDIIYAGNVSEWGRRGGCVVACAKLRGSVAGLGRGGVCVYQEEPERSNAVTWRFEGGFWGGSSGMCVRWFLGIGMRRSKQGRGVQSPKWVSRREKHSLAFIFGLRSWDNSMGDAQDFQGSIMLVGSSADSIVLVRRMFSHLHCK